MPGLRLASDQVFKIDDAGGQRTLVEVVLSSYSPAVGRTLVQSAFRSHYNAAVIAIARRGERLACKPGEVHLQAGDTLLLRSEEHTSELQSLMRISYAVFCLKKKKYQQDHLKICTAHI